MIPFILIRKILVSLAPLALFYLLRKVAGEQQSPKRKSQSSSFDPSTELRAGKSQIVEGEIVEGKK